MTLTCTRSESVPRVASYSVRRVALFSDGFLDRAGNVLDFGDRFRNLVDCNDGIVGRFLNFRHLDTDIFGRAGRLIGQVLHFRGDDRKTLSGFACAPKNGRKALSSLSSNRSAAPAIKTKLEDGGDLKWTVEPVGLNERWFPGQIRSRFASDRRLFGLSQR